MAPRNRGTIRLMSRLHALLWKLSGGKLGNSFGKVPFMMLTTKGRKTGHRRTTPVLYLQDGADFIVVASFGGNDVHPAWYLNLESCPQAEAVVKGERRRLVARKVPPEEKGLIWPRLIDLYPDFDLYRQRTTREIPLLRLSEESSGV
jgi:F420H(2)-dependent quinone reductase